MNTYPTQTEEDEPLTRKQKLIGIAMLLLLILLSLEITTIVRMLA
jgi:hypothetical protein